jgi:uncharacterized membrane protein YbaN (DUF454 family)
MLRWTLTIAGIVSLGLGVLGVFVPLLPTTPFLLLAAGCFVRSSPRLYAWLLGHRWFGDYIRHYREHRAISLRAKVVILAMLWATIGYAAIGVAKVWWLRALLVAIAVGVSAHVLRLRTLTPEMLARSQAEPEPDDA